MNTKKSYDLVEKIFEKTISGKLKWEQTLDENVFQVIFPEYAVKISWEEPNCETLTEEQAELLNEIHKFPVLKVYNSIGNQIQEIGFYEIYNEDNIYKKLCEIYEEAKNIAYNVDKSIDELMTELDKA